MSTTNYDRRFYGYTLIELTTVLAIVAILGAIALPRFASATSRSQLNASADRVISDLQLAQSRARASGSTVTVNFNLVADSYQVTPRGQSATLTHLNKSPYFVDIAAASFGGSATVVFNGFGIPANSGEVRLQTGSDMVVVRLSSNGEASR